MSTRTAHVHQETHVHIQALKDEGTTIATVKAELADQCQTAKCPLLDVCPAADGGDMNISTSLRRTGVHLSVRSLPLQQEDIVPEEKRLQLFSGARLDVWGWTPVSPGNRSDGSFVGGERLEALLLIFLLHN